MGTDAPAAARLGRLALDCGFTAVCELDIASLKPRPEVRGACAQDKCKSYGKNWSCPPACGALEDCEKSMRRFAGGLILQTTGALEDSLDYEAMLKIGGDHREHLHGFQAALLSAFADSRAGAPGSFLLLGAGACGNCGQCSYPLPCRFPEKMIVSMEAMGLVVSEVCTANNIPYYRGPNTLTYVGCVLF